MINQVRIKAILVGMAAGFLAGMIWSVLTALASPPLAQASSAANALTTSPQFVVLSLIGAFGSSLVAGWVAARMAIGAETINSVTVGVVILLLSAALFIPLGMSQFPLWYNIPAFVLTVPFTFLGGFIVMRARGKNNS